MCGSCIGWSSAGLARRLFILFVLATFRIKVDTLLRSSVRKELIIDLKRKKNNIRRMTDVLALK